MTHEPIADQGDRLRALAHPLRLQILDLISERGELTASQVGRLLGQNSANAAYHLRTLARSGYLEQAPGGTGREKPWRLALARLVDDLSQEDPRLGDAAVVARDARHARRVQQWHTDEPTAPDAWRRSSFEMVYDAWLTPDQLAEVGRAVNEAVMAVVAVDQPEPRPADAALVTIQCIGFPFGGLPA